MDLFVFAVVILAALFHATWNAFIKVDGDSQIFSTVLLAASGLGALCVTPFVAFPALEVWPYIIASVVLHGGYWAFLVLAYRYGDLSHVYPLARGSAPLIVAVAALVIMDEQLTRLSLLAVLLMAAGIMSLSLTRRQQGLHDPWAVFFALGTGLFIAAYTVTDAIGARLAVSAHSYAAWMLGLEWIPIAIFTLWHRGGAVFAYGRRTLKIAVPMGLISLAAYWAVIWAMTVAPAALVAALRESSIIFAMLFGVVFLKERLSLRQVAATFTALTGVMLMKFSRP